MRPSLGASNSLEKMIAHQVAAAHHAGMELTKVHTDLRPEEAAK
jgi:hypothetical protein